MPACIILIASCYFIALVFELLRFALRHWRHRWIGLVPAILGFIFHTFFLYRQHIISEQPLGGTAMLFLASAWGLVLIYFIWGRKYPNIPFGVIVLPLALLLLGGGYLSVSTFETTGLTLRTFAKMLHTASAAGCVIAFSVFVICGLLNFLESYLLRKKRSLAPPIKLPSLEWSATIGRISLAIAVGCLCLAGLSIVLFLSC